MTSRLYLDFCGEDLSLDPGDELTFGRAADLIVDDNPYLHRIVGRFVQRGDVWFVENLGRSIVLSVSDANGPSVSSVGPGSAAALVHEEFVCGFTAGPTRYEMAGTSGEHEWAVDLLGPDGPAGERTLDWGRVELNDDQRLLLVALCAATLRDPASVELQLPTNRQAASALGWTLSKFNRKLDHLCEKLHRAGVAGVHGELGASASDRRRRLAEHAVSIGLVTSGDLALIDGDRAA